MMGQWVVGRAIFVVTIMGHNVDRQGREIHEIGSKSWFWIWSDGGIEIYKSANLSSSGRTFPELKLNLRKDPNQTTGRRLL